MVDLARVLRAQAGEPCGTGQQLTRLAQLKLSCCNASLRGSIRRTRDKTQRRGTLLRQTDVVFEAQAFQFRSKSQAPRERRLNTTEGKTW